VEKLGFAQQQIDVLVEHFVWGRRRTPKCFASEHCECIWWSYNEAWFGGL